MSKRKLEIQKVQHVAYLKLHITTLQFLKNERKRDQQKIVKHLLSLQQVRIQSDY